MGEESATKVSVEAVSGAVLVVRVVDSVHSLSVSSRMEVGMYTFYRTLDGDVFVELADGYLLWLGRWESIKGLGDAELHALIEATIAFRTEEEEASREAKERMKERVIRTH